MRQNFVDLEPMEHFILLSEFLGIHVPESKMIKEGLIKKGYLDRDDSVEYIINKKGEAFCQARCKAKPDYKQLVHRNTPKENLALMNVLSYHMFKTGEKLHEILKQSETTVE